MKTHWNFSTKNGFTAIPSIALQGTPADTKEAAVKHAQEHGGRADVYTLTAICKFPGVKRETAFDYWRDGRAIGDGRARFV